MSPAPDFSSTGHPNACLPSWERKAPLLFPGHQGVAVSLILVSLGPLGGLALEGTLGVTQRAKQRDQRGSREGEMLKWVFSNRHPAAWHTAERAPSRILCSVSVKSLSFSSSLHPRRTAWERGRLPRGSAGRLIQHPPPAPLLLPRQPQGAPELW